MQHSTHIPEVSPLTDFHHFARFCALRDEKFEVLTVAQITGSLPPFPDQYIPPSYALEFILRGTTKGKVNGLPVELRPNDAFFILANDIHKEVEISADAELYVIGFTTRFIESLNLQLPQTQLAQLLMRRKWQMSETQMQVIQQYIGLLSVLIEGEQKVAVRNLVRSLIYYLTEEMALHPQQNGALTRPEQICGQYLSLVEVHCRSRHTVEWYADKMHLSPKYLSNVVKQTLRKSPNACLDEALMRQAKSLLSSTSLSVQEIADRLGFQNQSHFGTFFKRHSALNPSTFRKQTE